MAEGEWTQKVKIKKNNQNYLCSSYCASGPVLNTSYTSTHLIFTQPHEVGSFTIQFTVKETEIQTHSGNPAS